MAVVEPSLYIDHGHSLLYRVELLGQLHIDQISRSIYLPGTSLVICKREVAMCRASRDCIASLMISKIFTTAQF